jgi:hypothetical protein
MKVAKRNAMGAVQAISLARETATTRHHRLHHSQTKVSKTHGLKLFRG